METKYKEILATMESKSCAKQRTYENALAQFAVFKGVLKDFAEKLAKDIHKKDKSLEVYFKDINDFEAEFKFAGDVLIFSLHTNIFNFEPSHEIHQLPRVQEDPSRAYCALIQVYNFLGDTVKYNRSNDVGYLLARIFLNRNNHFFVEGKRQLGFLYNDFEKAEWNEVYMKAIAEACVEYALDFDLFTPPYKEVQEVSFSEKQFHSMNAGMKTGKRLGFQFSMNDNTK